MRVFTSGVKVVDGLFGAKLCLLAVCVFVCSIDRSYSTGYGTVTNATIKDPTRHHPSNLTDVQLKSAYTIEFNFTHINKTNRTAMNIAYQEARRKIVQKLNLEIRLTTPHTTIDTRPPPERKRKRRSREGGSEGNKSTLLTDDDHFFIDNGLEIDEYGVLRISFFINTTEFSEDELLDALNELKDGFKEIAPVIDVYKGLPRVKSAMADIRVWLPILLAIIILIIIFIVVYCCWKTTNRKVKDVEQQKIIPKQDSKPSTSNGHPRILDDNSGWLVPYEQFGSEQKI